jgi:hypothetical protein
MPAVRLIEMICLNSNGMNDHVYLVIKLKASWVILGAARAISTCLPYLLHGFFTYFFRWKGSAAFFKSSFGLELYCIHACLHLNLILPVPMMTKVSTNLVHRPDLLNRWSKGDGQCGLHESLHLHIRAPIIQNLSELIETDWFCQEKVYAARESLLSNTSRGKTSQSDDRSRSLPSLTL